MAKENKSITLPEGRLIHGHLFTKQQYNDKATPKYSAEMAFEEGVLEDAGIWAILEDICEDKDWDIDEITCPIKDGDKKAKKRSKKGKDGSAYEGMEVINASTIYNGEGDDDSGGVQVYDGDLDEIDVSRKREVYNGCIGAMSVKFVPYDTDGDGENIGITCYLTAFQLRGEGERLSSSSDHSTLFEKVGRKQGEKSKRKKRKE